MPREIENYLDDILDSIQRIEEYTAGNLKPTDNRTLDAVIRNFEVIGEAVKQIPETLREEHPSVVWREVAGFRDVLIHRYFEIEAEVIWDIIENEMPALKLAVEAMRKKCR